MKKNILFLLVVLCMLAGLLPAVHAAEPITGILGNNMAWSLDVDAGTLTISGEGDMPKSDNPWEAYRQQITRIVVQPGITSIGDYAFHSFTALTEVALPEGLTSIGQYAFFGCGALTRIRLPETLQSIHDSAFSGAGLAEIVIPDGTVYLGGNAFSNCSCLERVTLPEGLTAISDSLFRYCEKLTTLEIPASVQTIESFAFQNTGLKRIEIPGSVPYLGYYVFADCRDLEEVILNEGLTTLAVYCFQNCIALKSLTLPESLTELDGEGIFAGSGLVELHIPEGPMAIGWWTFQDCPDLKKVTMGNSVREIGKEAFAGCTSLETVILSDRITRIDEMAFRDSGLVEIILPRGVDTILEETFLNCTRLKSVQLPESLEEISRSAFQNCTSLKMVKLPDRLKRIRQDAFKESGLIRMDIPMSVESIDNLAFGYCPELTDVYFPESLLYIDGGAFVASEQVTIYCYEGSKAHEFALSKGYPYVLRSSDGSIFKDVSTDKYYYKPVMWAVENGITSGTGNGKFSPNMTCTRGQVVTFLWRAAGEPEPTSMENPFSDVKESDYYYKAVLWAVENGITSGTGNGRFSPNMACSRAQVATFLWRTLGRPEVTGTENPFSDVKSGQYYTEAVLWAVEYGITTGVGNGKFAPNASCSRGQIVTFLYRVDH